MFTLRVLYIDFVAMTVIFTTINTILIFFIRLKSNTAHKGGF